MTGTGASGPPGVEPPALLCVIVPDISTSLHILRGIKTNMKGEQQNPLTRNSTTLVVTREQVTIATMVTLTTVTPGHRQRPATLEKMEKRCRDCLSESVVTGRSTPAPVGRSTTTTVAQRSHSGKSQKNGWKGPVNQTGSPLIPEGLWTDKIPKKLKIDTQVDHWKNVKSTLVTYDTWLPMATQNLIKNTCLKNCNKVSLNCKQSCNRTPRTKHKMRIIDALVTLLVLHMAQQTVLLVGDSGGTVTDQMVPGRSVDKALDRIPMRTWTYPLIVLQLVYDLQIVLRLRS